MKIKRGIKEIKGLVVSSGKVKGRVKILYTPKNLSKMKKGDILVAPMTSPDYITAMRKAAKYFIGKKDFKSFQSSDKKRTSSVRTIERLSIVKKDPKIEIYIQADGFLYKMVRNIVGTLIDVGRGRLKHNEVKEILSKRHRPAAGQTAPAKGLCLVRVVY